jgi:hypothetical protein
MAATGEVTVFGCTSEVVVAVDAAACVVVATVAEPSDPAVDTAPSDAAVDFAVFADFTVRLRTCAGAGALVSVAFLSVAFDS